MKYSRIIIVFCLSILFISGLACSSLGEETTTPPTSLPSAPILSSPNNHAEVAGTSIQFTWQPSSDTTKYLLRVSEDPNLAEEHALFSVTLKHTVYSYQRLFNDRTEYVWGVWSGNEAGWCDKSEVLANKRIFTTVFLPPPPSAPNLD